MTTTGFAELFRRASAEVTGGRAYLPGEILNQWTGVVDLIRDGYPGSLDEYFSDLAVRRSLQATLDHALLADRPERGWIGEQVTAADDRLRALLQRQPLPRSDGQPWWERFPPRYAGSDLAADFRSVYDVRVDVRED
jgi:hypothetical protein